MVEGPREEEVVGFSIGVDEGSDAGKEAEISAAEEGEGLAVAEVLKSNKAAYDAVWQAGDGGF